MIQARNAFPFKIKHDFDRATIRGGEREREREQRRFGE
jgi:hypothetical protein